MNNFDDWSQIISKYLKSESDPLNTLSKHELEDDAARTAFVRAVLDRFLPEIYGVGSGQIMDSKGKLSGRMDIIIYRRDFPRLDLPGSRDIYLYESVIATIEVVGKLVKKSFFDALNQCAALGELNPDIDEKVMTGLAARNQLTLNENREFVHPDPVRTSRFHLIGRPFSFIYGFSGYKTSTRQLAETLEAWMQERNENRKPVDMKSLPAVIATQGCFAWRNSAPYTVKENCLMGVGTDPAPIRLIVLQLLHTLSRRLKVTTDSFGLKPGLDGYLTRMPPPVMETFVGKARNPVSGEEAVMEKMITAKSTKPVKKPAPVTKPAAAKKAEVKPAVAKKSEVKPTVAKKPEVKPAVAKKPEVKPALVAAKPATKPAVKPVPASVEKPAVESVEKPVIEIRSRPTAVPTPAPTSAPSKIAEEKPAAKSLGSFDTKPEAVDAPFPEPNADLIPALDPNPPGGDDQSESHVPAFAKPAASVSDISQSAARPKVETPATDKPAVAAVPKPAINTAKQTGIDIELDPTPAEKPEPVAAVDSAAESFVETMKLKMSMPEQEQEQKFETTAETTSSSGDFMETVKMQLSNPEPFPELQPKSEPEPEPFTSTIPQ